MFDAICAFLARIFIHPALMPPAPIIVEPEPVLPQPEVVKPKRDILQELCDGISVYEGGPGDLNHKNCNPGNVRFFSAGYAPIYGTVLRDKSGFAIFKDWPTGMLYLRNMIRARALKNPKQTLQQFINVYAPSSENSPVLYAKFLAKRLNVDKDIFRMAELVV